MPEKFFYIANRKSIEGVINTDPKFRSCCDCDDDCQVRPFCYFFLFFKDKEKCSCWQVTLKEATLNGLIPESHIGYSFKRLIQPATAIYECNSGCKCRVDTCLNRVAQHPLSLKLQVFKTASRGWGIRCLHDIPKGTFICTYSGIVMTDEVIIRNVVFLLSYHSFSNNLFQEANDIGRKFGDEYFADLDYAEVTEGLKEGYERYVVDPEDVINKPTFTGGKSVPVRQLFGKDESVYTIDAKHWGNVGRFINVRLCQLRSHMSSECLGVN